MDLFGTQARNDAVFGPQPARIAPPPLPPGAAIAIGGDSCFWARAIAQFLPDRVASRASLYAKACGGGNVRDLLFHLPTSYTDRRHRVRLADAPESEICTFLVQVHAVTVPDRKKSPAVVVVSDSSAMAEIVLFAHWAAAAYTIGETMVVSGEVRRRSGRIQIVHPHHALPESRAAELPWVEPVWGLTNGLSRTAMGSVMRTTLAAIPTVNEWVHPSVIKQHGWPGFRDALHMLHAPHDLPGPAARQRLAYDEAFARALSTEILKRDIQSREGIRMLGSGSLRDEAIRRFGSALTDAQAAAVDEILADMGSGKRMLRLLQGDVGSGKTLVALMSMLAVAEAGYQSALIAPTEILAKQHYMSILRLSPVPVALLISNLSTAEKRRARRDIASGEARIVIGTHALIQKDIEFRSLGLAVIDEQHRFGVDHRTALAEKGDRVHALVMTATPIPRTVLLSSLGWMTVTALRGKPRGRVPIRTSAHSVSRINDVFDSVGRMIAGGGRVYWVCPLINESESSDMAAAVARYDALRERFGDLVTIAHGRQQPSERDQALAEFASGKKTVLVSTTVVEVGVDVPEATVMVIDQAERFGAAQLHQLRGRVGRGSARSYCLLLCSNHLPEIARRRIDLLCRTNDGFEIAEADFRLRGGGDTLGTQQTGQENWRVASLETDQELIDIAARDAAHLLANDPDLKTTRGQAARICMVAFGVQDSLRYSASG